MKKNAIVILIIAILIFSVYLGFANFHKTYANENSIKHETTEKTLEFEKDMTGYRSIRLPFVVGDINVNFTDTQNLKVSVKAIVDGSDLNYQKSLLANLSIKGKEEDGEIELDPYIGNHMLYEKTAEYDRNKCNIKMNYTLQIPKNVKNINLSSTDGTIKTDSIKCDMLNIETINGKFIAKDIQAKEISLDSTLSDISIKEKITCDNMKVKLINGNMDIDSFDGMIDAETISSNCTITKGDFKNQSNIKNSGNITLGIHNMNADSNLAINSYAGEIHLNVDKNIKCTLYSNEPGSIKKDTKTFNGGGPEINIELSGGKLVLK